LCSTDSCCVKWTTISAGARALKFGEGTHWAMGLRGGAWVQAASASEQASRTARRSMVRPWQPGAPLHRIWRREACRAAAHGAGPASAGVIHLVFQRVGGGAVGGDFLHLHLDVGVDEVVAHHPAGLEELAVGVQRAQ